MKSQDRTEVKPKGFVGGLSGVLRGKERRIRSRICRQHGEV